MDLTKVVELIRGPKGTQVRLTIEGKDDPASRHVVILTRDVIKLEDQEAKAKLIELPDDRGGTNRIGVIDVPSFYAPVGSDAHNYISVDVAKLIKKLEQEKVAGIILDMRSNPGGSLEEAIRFTGLFIKKGPVVLARNTEGQVQVDSIAESYHALFRAARRPASTATARPPRKSPPPPCRITTARSSSATSPRTAKARCKISRTSTRLSGQPRRPPPMIPAPSKSPSASFTGSPALPRN